MEIGIATFSLYSYEEMTRCGEPFLGEINDERRVIDNSKIEAENKEKRGRGDCERKKRRKKKTEWRERKEKERVRRVNE